MRQAPSTTRSQRSPVAAVVALCVTILAGILAQPSAGQGGAEMRGFERVSDYVLWIDGKEAGSEIYQSQSAAALLLISSAFTSPVLLAPSHGAAEKVNLMKVDKKPDATIDLLQGAVMATLGPISFEEDNIAFSADGRNAVLKPTPPLLGMHRVAEVTAHNPEYLPRATAYAPNPGSIATLKKEQRNVTVRVFFGSWCPHCRQMVPHAIKVEQLLQGSGSKVHFEYFGLPPHFGTDPAARTNGISAVPTGIVYLGGKEVGRLQSQSWVTPENALVNMLRDAK